MEKQFIDWLNEHKDAEQVPVVVGIGDDGAVMDLPGPTVVVSDSIADGVHFDVRQHDFSQIGHKSIAVNLSDIAAMGAKPVAATVDFFLPQTMTFQQIIELYQGIQTTAEKYGVQIIGGDTNRWSPPLVISVTVIGVRFDLDRERDFWRMDRARPNEMIFVSGSLGGSIRGKHIGFEPRLQLAERLMQNFRIACCTDITDSLAVDLAAIARKSAVGFVLDASRIPVSDDARFLSRKSGQGALEHALYDGEDFELLFTIDSEQAAKIENDPVLSAELTMIGQTTDELKFQIRHCEGRPPSELTIRGYDH